MDNYYAIYVVAPSFNNIENAKAKAKYLLSRKYKDETKIGVIEFNDRSEASNYCKEILNKRFHNLPW